MSKALFYGGAFNPVTKAHIELANFARETLHYDKVIFMPTKDKYIKHEEGKDFVFPERIRFSLLQKVSQDYEWMVVSDYELNLEEQPRTYFTLQALKKEGYDIQLLIGSDWLPKLKNGWKYVEEICQEFGIVILSRSDDNLHAIIEKDDYLKSIKPYLTLLETPNTYRDISSTKVRALYKTFLETTSELKQMVPDEVMEILCKIEC